MDKRAIVESVFDILSSVTDIEHTRPRKPLNAYVPIFSALRAYQKTLFVFSFFTSNTAPCRLIFSSTSRYMRTSMQVLQVLNFEDIEQRKRLKKRANAPIRSIRCGWSIAN